MQKCEVEKVSNKERFLRQRERKPSIKSAYQVAFAKKEISIEGKAKIKRLYVFTFVIACCIVPL